LQKFLNMENALTFHVCGLAKKPVKFQTAAYGLLGKPLCQSAEGHRLDYHLDGSGAARLPERLDSCSSRRFKAGKPAGV